MPSLYLIDAHAYLHRAFHALPPLTTSKGQPIGAIYGFIRMIQKINKQYKPDYLAVCFDTAAPTFRHIEYKEYKATRVEIDETLVSQFPIALEATDALGLASFAKDGFEADDLISTLTRAGRKKGWDVVIVSGDKDALQLVGDGVRVLNEFKNILFGPEEVRARYGLAPHQIPDMLALMGDAADNVPGVKGIGEKTAVKLLQEYSDIENLLKSASSIKGKTGTLLIEQADSARQSLSLVKLDRDVPLQIDWEACRIQTPKTETLMPFVQKYEMNALLKDLPAADKPPVDHSACTYETITTENALREWLKKPVVSGQVALDTETMGLDSLTTPIVGISLSDVPGSACYIPVGHQMLGGPTQLTLDQIRQPLTELLSNPKIAVYGHNLKYDLQVLEHHGIPCQNIRFDTMVASYVLNPSRNGHGLKDLALEILGQPMTPIEQLIGKGAKQVTMDAVDIDKTAPYACADADMTLRLGGYFAPQLKEKGLEKLMVELEMPLIRILSDMETLGMRIDRKYLDQLGKELRGQADSLEKQIYALAGETFNINSPKQLSVILFEKLKLPVIRRTKTGISTDEEVLTKLSEQHDLPRKLIEYRELQKMQSTYIESLLESARGDEDRVHTSFNQAVAATGRLSSSNPNLQNIPIRTELGRRIRKAFVPKAGWTLLSADYSQIDLRMLAHMSEDKTMCEAFQRGEDIHTTTACEIFGIKPEAMTPDIRRVAKSINFGIVYGISAFGLSQQLGIPMDEAQKHINRYFERYPGVKSWIDQTLASAHKDGYVRTLLGRIRYLPEINAANPSMRSFAERTAMNTPIQGTSADVIKLAMIHVAEARKRNEWQGNMLVQVHDELLFEIPPDALASSQVKIKLLMENALPLRIPVIVDLKSGPNWTDMTAVGKSR